MEKILGSILFVLQEIKYRDHVHTDDMNGDNVVNFLLGETVDVCQFSMSRAPLLRTKFPSLSTSDLTSTWGQ